MCKNSQQKKVWQNIIQLLCRGHCDGQFSKRFTFRCNPLSVVVFQTAEKVNFDHIILLLVCAPCTLCFFLFWFHRISKYSNKKSFQSERVQEGKGRSWYWKICIGLLEDWAFCNRFVCVCFVHYYPPADSKSDDRRKEKRVEWWIEKRERRKRANRGGRQFFMERFECERCKERAGLNKEKLEIRSRRW